MLPLPRVLIVGSCLPVIKTLTKLLESWGHDVLLAHDGPRAMQAVLAYQPDVVLIDLSLPGLDGVQVARAIRQQRSLDGVQLIALSQIAEDRFRRQVEDVGFDDYLPKPIDPVHLQELLAANTEALRI